MFDGLQHHFHYGIHAVGQERNLFHSSVTLHPLVCSAGIATQLILRSSLTMHFTLANDLTPHWLSTQMVISVGLGKVCRIQPILSLITRISACFMTA